MQPTYLPWLGYFDLMDRVDYFVLLDSVQFAKRSWQQRNQIKIPQGKMWLTVPVVSKGRYQQKISQVKIDRSTNFASKHLKAIAINYAKAKYFRKYYPSLAKIISRPFTNLVDLNISLIEFLKKTLTIRTTIKRSQDLNVAGKKGELLIKICKKLKMFHYLSPVGAKNYLKDDNSFKENRILLTYQRYQHPPYQQLNGEFISHLSVIDLIFNHGPQSLAIIKTGRE